MEWFARPKRKPRSDKGSSKRKATDARFDGMPVLLPVCKCANLTNLQGCEFVEWLGGMDLGAVRSSWDEYRDQRRRSKRTNSMRTRGELGKANADVSKSHKL
jgi:hypothetical protein